MGFSLSDSFGGMIGGAGIGLMAGGPLGAGIGAGVGGLISGFLTPETPQYEMPSEMKAEMEYQRKIARGEIESPETISLRNQANQNYRQVAGLMGTERGASRGARSGYLANYLGQQQAQTNEQATLANAAARRASSQYLTGLYGEQAKMDYQNKLAEYQKKQNLMGNMSQLAMLGALAYGKSGPTDKFQSEDTGMPKGQDVFEGGVGVNPYSDSFGVSKYNHLKG